MIIRMNHFHFNLWHMKGCVFMMNMNANFCSLRRLVPTGDIGVSGEESIHR